MARLSFLKLCKHEQSNIIMSSYVIPERLVGLN
jgi:hypothetical protein